MKRLFAALLLACALPVAAQEFTPVEGTYWNPSESGTGYTVAVQNGVMVTHIYSYNTDGTAQWYLVTCPINSKSLTCTGALQRYADGQSIGGSYVKPHTDGKDGTAKFTWLSESKIEVVLPQGRVTEIVPFDFKRYEGARALLGKWVFIAFLADGSTVSTPVLDFTLANDDEAVAPAQSAGCVALPKAAFACQILDKDKMPNAVWIVTLNGNDARGRSGNTLDGNVIVQGYRLDAATDAGPVVD